LAVVQARYKVQLGMDRGKNAGTEFKTLNFYEEYTYIWGRVFCIAVGIVEWMWEEGTVFGLFLSDATCCFASVQ
jgi:hypothetical protein